MTINIRLPFLIPALIFTLVSGGLFAQQRDFNTWWEWEFGYDLNKDLSFSAELEHRLKYNSSSFDRSLITLSGSYDVHQYFRAGGGIRMLAVADPEENLQARYRIHLDGSGRYSWAGVQWSLRVRLQYGFEEFLYFYDLSSNKLANRYRLKAEHHVFGQPFDLFASIEPWGVFGAQDGRFFKRMRYSLGANYRISMIASVGLRYILEDEFNRVNPMTSHIVVLGYTHKF